MTVTQWGQGLAGLDSTKKEYAQKVQDFQIDCAYFDYRTKVLKNKQGWLKIFNAANAALMTTQAMVACSDEKFKELNNLMPSGTTETEIQNKIQSSYVPMATDLIELPVMIFSNYFVSRFLTVTHEWMYGVMEETENIALRWMSGAVAGVTWLVEDALSFTMRLLTLPLRTVISGMVEVADRYGNVRDSDLFQWFYEKTGVEPTFALTNDINRFTAEFKSAGEGIQTLLKKGAEDAANSGANASGSLQEMQVRLLESDAVESPNLDPLNIESTPELDALEPIADVTESEASASFSNFLSATAGVAAAAGVLLGVDTLLGYWEGEKEKEKYQDAIDILNTHITDINKHADKLEKANTCLNKQTKSAIKQFCAVYKMFTDKQTQYGNLTEQQLSDSFIDAFDFDAQIHLTDDEKKQLVTYSYNPYDWSYPDDPANNPYCTAIEPTKAYLAATVGVVSHNLLLVQIKTMLLNEIDNEPTLLLENFWSQVLLFLPNRGVIEIRGVQTDLHQLKNQQYAINILAITSKKISDLLKTDANKHWLYSKADTGATA